MTTRNGHDSLDGIGEVLVTRWTYQRWGLG